MGLDTTHNAFHGAYSSFARWRDWLASKRGFVLRDMVSFGGENEWTPEMKEDPLYPLLNHSDCEGELTPEECKRILSGLDEVVRLYVGDLEPEEMLIRCKQFRDGCILAIESNEPIEFH